MRHDGVCSGTKEEKQSRGFRCDLLHPVNGVGKSLYGLNPHGVFIGIARENVEPGQHGRRLHSQSAITLTYPTHRHSCQRQIVRAPWSCGPKKTSPVGATGLAGNCKLWTQRGLAASEMEHDSHREAEGVGRGTVGAKAHIFELRTQSCLARAADWHIHAATHAIGKGIRGRTQGRKMSAAEKCLRKRHNLA